MREMEGRIETVEKRQDSQADELKQVNARVDSTDKGLERLEKRIDEDCSGSNVLNELRERKARRLNIILYGVGESESTVVDERRCWDKQSCLNIFKALKLNVELKSIKYVRRIGEKGDRPRPLLAGMSTEAEKEMILDNARALRDTRYKNVGISADLTPWELKEERELAAEAARRNEELDDEDRAKNLKWLLVGQKGARRLIKGVERVPPTSNSQRQPSPPPPGLNAQPGQERPRLSSKRGHSTESEGETSTQPAKTTQKRRYTQRPQTPTGTAEEETMAVDPASQPPDINEH